MIDCSFARDKYLLRGKSAKSTILLRPRFIEGGRIDWMAIAEILLERDIFYSFSALKNRASESRMDKYFSTFRADWKPDSSNNYIHYNIILKEMIDLDIFFKRQISEDRVGIGLISFVSSFKLDHHRGHFVCFSCDWQHATGNTFFIVVITLKLGLSCLRRWFSNFQIRYLIFVSSLNTNFIWNENKKYLIWSD